MEKVTLKRALAFIIDIVIVLMIGSLFSKVEILNPTMEEYDEVFQKYNEMLLETEDSTEISDISDIDETSDISTASESKKDSKEKQEEMIKITIDLAKYGLPINIINLVITISYFMVFQYFNKGQTIGKKLTKIKIVSDNGNRLKFTQILLRTGIINSIFVSVLTVLCVILLNGDTYYYSALVLSILDMALVYFSIIMMLFNKKSQGIHDILAHTLVVSEQTEVSEVKEAKYKEKTK